MTFRMLCRVILGTTLLVGCAALSRPSVGAETPRRIDVVAKRFTYTPAEITLKKGEPVVFEFQSDDVTHGIKFKELNLQTEIRRGVVTELAFMPTQTGTFVGHCSHFCGSGHGSMILTLHVTE